jgi:hypothetical protein
VDIEVYITDADLFVSLAVMMLAIIYPAAIGHDCDVRHDAFRQVIIGGIE